MSEMDTFIPVSQDSCTVQKQTMERYQISFPFYPQHIRCHSQILIYPNKTLYGKLALWNLKI